MKIKLGIVFVIIIALVLVFVFTRDGRNAYELPLADLEGMTQAPLTTNLGDITIEFFDDMAPKTVENFLTLAGEGFYDGIRFHRVIEGFMIQAGDPNTRDGANREKMLGEEGAWGTGGPGYTFEDEIHERNENKRGTISMANAGPGTNGSQFFINTVDNDSLNPRHTVFGRVIDGMDVVEQIEQSTTSSDRPLDDVIIESVAIVAAAEAAEE